MWVRINLAQTGVQWLALLRAITILQFVSWRGYFSRDVSLKHTEIRDVMPLRLIERHQRLGKLDVSLCPQCIEINSIRIIC